MRHLLLALPLVIAACSGTGSNANEMQGPTGPEGPRGPKGDKGDPGAVTTLDGGTIQGPTGPAGASAQVDQLPVGDASCPLGGVRVSVGTSSTVVCNGPAGPTGAAGPTGTQGPPGIAGGPGPAGATGATGATGPIGPIGPTGAAGVAGPAGPSVVLTPLANGNANCPYGGTQLVSGASTTYVCNGAPASGGSVTYNGGIPPVSFAGYTPATYGGNLGGRSGAHALCDSAFTGSHFCADWEVDQSTPPAASGSVWVDTGNDVSTTRLFRSTYSTSDLSTCAGWTSSIASVKPDGVNTGTGLTFTSLGGFKSSFVGLNDGGCEVSRQLACCHGGTAVRFRGFTPTSTGGNLGGRSGAHATCNANFSGSHFCADWELDQAAVRAPIPASGAWADTGNNQPSSRLYRATYSTSDLSTCAGWTSATANVKPDGVNTGTGQTLTPLGGFKSSFVGLNDGGCEVTRPLACCDGYPPQ